MRRAYRFFKEMVNDILRSIRSDFTPDLYYEPYEPKVLGNKIKGDKTK